MDGGGGWAAAGGQGRGDSTGCRTPSCLTREERRERRLRQQMARRRLRRPIPKGIRADERTFSRGQSPKDGQSIKYRLPETVRYYPGVYRASRALIESRNGVMPVQFVAGWAPA